MNRLGSRLSEIQPKLQAIRRTGIAEQIASQIVNLIQSGSLEAGDRLPSERKLASQLGIGRPALREAVRALSMLGILHIQHGGGIFVSELTPDALFGPLHLYIGLDVSNLVAINEAREVIEGGIMAHIAPHFPEDLLVQLRHLVEEMDQYFSRCEEGEVDLERVQQDAQEFRRIIGLGIHNPILLRSLEGIDVLSAAVRSRLDGWSGSWEWLMESHRKILAALEGHDSTAAQEAVVAHIRTIDAFCQDNFNNQQGQK